MQRELAHARSVPGCGSRPTELTATRIVRYDGVVERQGERGPIALASPVGAWQTGTILASARKASCQPPISTDRRSEYAP